VLKTYASCLALVVAACGDDSSNPNDRPDGGPFIPPANIDCKHVGSGVAYDVGDGKTYPTLGDVPWHMLGAGDTVLIHYRAAPYREKILISNSGSDGQPIRVCGVAGPNGELPVIDGANATTSPNQRWSSYLPLQDLAVAMIAADDDDPYEYRPEWITIEGLVFTGGKSSNSYTNSEGDVRPYEGIIAGLFVVPGAHLVIRGNVFTDNAVGFFTLSKDETDFHVVEDLLLEGNSFYGNGEVGIDTRHNCYIQAMGVVVQYNHFGRLRPGALGGNLKDRSSGTIVRYNWIEGGARQLDLVDAQEHVRHAMADPRYRETFVYGNIILNSEPAGDGGHIVHYGGDTLGFEQNFRKGTLYFYNNTVVTEADEVDRYRTGVVEAATNDETVDMRNNVIVRRGSTNMGLLARAGRLELGVNWISQGYWIGYEDFMGTVSGESNVIAGTDPALGDMYRPAAGSPVIDRAGATSPGAPEVLGEYVPHQQGIERVVSGAGRDLGAFEARP
jgi:hypothetical protein